MNKYLNMFRAGGKGKTFMRSADKLKSGFNEGIKPLTDAIDSKLDNEKEKVEKTPLQDGSSKVLKLMKKAGFSASDQPSETSSVSTEKANTNFFNSLDINQVNQDRRNKANEEFRDITTFNRWRYDTEGLTENEKAMKRGFDAANEFAEKY